MSYEHRSEWVHVEPAAEPISPAELKAHLRITVDDDDTTLLVYIGAARRYVEARLHRSLVTQTRKIALDGFRCWTLLVPYGPVQSITSIQYVDDSGTTQTLDSSRYLTDLRTDPARIEPAYAQTWPSTRVQMSSVTVTYVAGYGTPDDVPQDIRQAIRMLAGYYYEQREAAAAQQMAPGPFAVDALIAPYRILEAA